MSKVTYKTIGWAGHGDAQEKNYNTPLIAGLWQGRKSITKKSEYPDLQPSSPSSALQMTIGLHTGLAIHLHLHLILQHQLNDPVDTPLRKPKLHNLQPRPLHQV